MSHQVISRYCRLKNKTLAVNSKVLYRDSSLSLEDWFVSAYKKLEFDYPRFYKMDRLAKLGYLAAEALLKGADISEYAQDAIGIVLANSHSSLDTDKRYSEAAQSVPSPALFVYTLPNIVTGELAIRFKLKGENAFFISAAFDAETITSYVDQVFLSGSVEACIGGWVDIYDEHHDVLLYLVEKRSRKEGLPHTADQVNLLYQEELWNS